MRTENFVNTRFVQKIRGLFELRSSSWFRKDQLIKTLFSGRRYLYLLISYTVLSKECFFRLSDCEMYSLKEQRIAVKFCVQLGKFTNQNICHA